MVLLKQVCEPNHPTKRLHVLLQYIQHRWIRCFQDAYSCLILHANGNETVILHFYYLYINRTYILQGSLINACYHWARAAIDLGKHGVWMTKFPSNISYCNKIMIKQKPVLDNDHTYNFKVGQQPHYISHVSEDQQASDGRQQGAGGPDHGAPLHRGTRVISKLWGGNTHRLSCKREDTIYVYLPVCLCFYMYPVKQFPWTCFWTVYMTNVKPSSDVTEQSCSKSGLWSPQMLSYL